MTPAVASSSPRLTRPGTLVERDLVIAGGGLVGATLAVALGRAGLPVTVLERTTATPELLRGELILPAGVAALRELGLVDRLAGVTLETEGVDLRHRAFPAPLRLTYPAGPGLCGWRRPLYEALRAAARETPGVEWRDGFEAAHVTRDAERRLTVAARDGQAAVRTRLLVVADGQGSRLRRQLGFEPLEDHAATLVQGLVLRAPGYARRRVVVGSHALGAAFVFPFPGGLARCTFEHRVLRHAQVAADDPLARHLELLREALPDVWEELGGAALEPVTELSVQPGRTTTLGGLVEDGVALAGDAAGCLDPFTGHGMALGLLDAATLAQVIIGGAARDPSAARLRAHERARQGRLLARREATDALCCAFLGGDEPLSLALAARLGARWTDPRVAPAIAAQAAGYDLPGPAPSLAERLFALGAL